jgi:periplasmic protein TonB
MMLFVLIFAFALFIGLLWGFGKVYGHFLMAKAKTEVQIAEMYKNTELSKSVFVKKYPEASIGDHKKYLLALGFILSFGVSIYALSYRDKPKDLSGFVMETIELDAEVEPPQTEQIKPPPPPPPPPEIEVVKDDEILEDEPEIKSVEIDIDTKIEVPEVIEKEVVKEQEIFTVVEDMPRFPGCENKPNKAEKEQCAQTELMKYLAKIQYPPMARDNDIEGKVFVRFVIDEKGKVTNVEIARGADKLLDQAALKHVQAMPDWIPGKQRGKNVKVQYVVPINFKLG